MISNGKRKKVVVVLGAIGECYPYDFTTMGWEAKEITDFIHECAYKELVNRNLHVSWGWSVRTKSMFLNNRLHTIGNVVHLQSVNKLIGCGFKVRKEVYDVFRHEFSIELKQWHPDQYWKKFRFSEKDED